MKKIVLLLTVILFYSCHGVEYDECKGTVNDSAFGLTDCSDCCEAKGYDYGVYRQKGLDRDSGRCFCQND